jgi:hypothetical protein
LAPQDDDLWKDLNLFPSKVALRYPIDAKENVHQFDEAAIQVLIADEVAESVHATFHKLRVRYTKEAVLTDEEKAYFNKTMGATEWEVAIATIAQEEGMVSTEALAEEDGEFPSVAAAEGESRTRTDKGLAPALASTEAGSKLAASALDRTTRWPSEEDAVISVLEYGTPQQEEAAAEGIGTPTSHKGGTATGVTETGELFVSSMHPGAPGAASLADDSFLRDAGMSGSFDNSNRDEDDPMEFATQEHLES